MTEAYRLLRPRLLSMVSSSTFQGSRYWVSGYPHLVEQWDTERNGTLRAEAVTAGSGVMVWWRCPGGPDHRWRAKPNNRTRGAGCPYCTNRRVSVTNSLAARSPRIAAEWHPTRNGLVGPADITGTSTRVCWWQCSLRPEHQWRAAVRDRSRHQKGCPYCARRRVSDESSLARWHPQIAVEWDPMRNGDLSPRDVVPGSSRRVWWRCRHDPAHAWQAAVANRVRRSSGCPHCRRRTSSLRNASTTTRTPS